MTKPMNIVAVVEELLRIFGKPKSTRFDGPLEMILWENVVYLADDRKREAAFEALRAEIGLSPGRILSTSKNALLAVTRMAGILPDNQVAKLRRIAEIVQDNFDGDLDQVLKQPLAQAKRSLRKFPGIGEPGAEKILLFCGAYPVFALESNGLRVLLRLGFGEEQRSYAAGYRSAQDAVKSQMKTEFSWLIMAHHLLRRHGQDVCHRTGPICDACPLTNGCRFYQAKRMR